MAMSSGGSGKLSGEINITPMIDILLVLLIIFLMIIPTKPVGEQTFTPQDSQSPSPPPATTIVIELTAVPGQDRPAIRINHEPVSWEAFPDRVQAIYLKRSDKVAFLQADDDLAFEYVAQIIDTARLSGADRVALMSKKAAS
jgi:biopolymer transport protein TolR